ncbi:MAG: asparagine--tRNA ligase [Elusimicrobia bacterium]|nr:asparagine--tRNA ligase [Elusimicrobiota bacterium]
MVIAASSPWVYISDIAGHDGKEITLKGWLYNKRSSGKIRFLQIRDGTGIIQCVAAKGAVSDDIFDLSDKITQESSIIVTGKVRRDARSAGGFELDVTDLKLVHAAKDYPIAPKEHGVGFLMEQRHLWLRSSRQHAILKIRSEIIRAIREYFDSNGFVMLDAPIFTPAACEGTSTLFETKYFDQKAFLTQSGQLYMEAGAMAFGRVYCFGPTFRAEKSKTRRHLTEFWMIEPEMAYFELKEDMDLAEDFVSYVVGKVVERKKKEFELLGRDIFKLQAVQKPFPRITYDEAIRILKDKGASISWGDDFGGDEETIISQKFDRPVMIHRYPAKCKAFYMKNDPANPTLALNFDMIAPEGYGEIIGGGQREDDYDTLVKKIDEHRLPQQAFEWYLDLRRFGTVPHAGFGLGIERTVAWLCSIAHVRETIPFPRLLDKIVP